MIIIKIFVSLIFFMIPCLILLWIFNGTKRYGNYWNVRTTLAVFLALVCSSLAIFNGLLLLVLP